MALKMNAARKFSTPVTVHFHDDEGNPAQGSFGATFKVVPFDKLKEETDSTLLDLVLVSVNESDLELSAEDGQRLTGENLIHFVKNDPSISTALAATYNEAITKKNLKRT